MPGYVEKSDSSSAQVRALASALNNKHFDIYSTGLLSRSLARWFSWLPKDIVSAGARIAAVRIGVPQSASSFVRSNDMASSVAALYPQREYKSLLIGAPNGGISHIGSIIDAPFLTSHFLLCFNDIRNVDDVYTTLFRARRLAMEIIRNNPDVHVVAHYDPVHDRPVLLFINHLRAKLTSVPRSYDHFISKHLAHDGVLILIRCKYSWLQYKVRDRFSFQIGGLGGIPDFEYLEGSERLIKYRSLQKGLKTRDGGWRLKSTKYPIEQMPESEWGGMPQFEEAVADYAAKKGIPLLVLTANHPEQYSELAFDLHVEASARDGVEPLFVFADCFNQLDPFANLSSRLIPLWLPYYCDRSYSFAKRMISKVSRDSTILLTIHPSLADPFDMVPLEEWIRLATTESEPILIGLDKNRFPYDAKYLFDFGRQLKSFSDIHPDPVITRLDARTLAEKAAHVGIGVEWL